MAAPDPLDELVSAVAAGTAYQQIDRSLIQSIAKQELKKGRSFKETIRAVRSRLHQAGGAFQGSGINYQSWKEELSRCSSLVKDPGLRDFCRKMMRCHASTRERLPDMEEFYRQTLSPVGQIHSLLDLACGLNPLSMPWLDLAPGAVIYTCDIYADLAAFLNDFFRHTGLNGRADVCDLTSTQPTQPVQLALLLKSIPCLEQLDKNCVPQLLDSVIAEYMLVTYPAHSLGGRSKGMPKNYEKHFEELTGGRNWRIQRFRFPSEIAYLIQK